MDNRNPKLHSILILYKPPPKRRTHDLYTTFQGLNRWTLILLMSLGVTSTFTFCDDTCRSLFSGMRCTDTPSPRAVTTSFLSSRRNPQFLIGSIDILLRIKH